MSPSPPRRIPPPGTSSPAGCPPATGTTPGPGGVPRGGPAPPAPGGRGGWLPGPRDTGGTGCVADCKTMDTVYVPVTAMTDPPAWHIQPGVLPSGDGYDLGTVVSMSHVTGH